MIRRLALLGGAAALSLTAAVAGALPAHAAGARGVTCGLTGSAKFTPGLTTTAKAGKFTFAGKLASCESTDATLKSGTVSASGSGTASCAEGTAKGIAVIKWNNRKITVVSFTTQNAAAVVEVSTKVIKSTKVGLTTYTTNEPATAVGDSGAGLLAFQVADPTQCTTTTGVTVATFQGQIGSGSPQ